MEVGVGMGEGAGYTRRSVFMVGPASEPQEAWPRLVWASLGSGRPLPPLACLLWSPHSTPGVNPGLCLGNWPCVAQGSAALSLFVSKQTGPALVAVMTVAVRGVSYPCGFLGNTGAESGSEEEGQQGMR